MNDSDFKNLCSCCYFSHQSSTIQTHTTQRTHLYLIAQKLFSQRRNEDKIPLNGSLICAHMRTRMYIHLCMDMYFIYGFPPQPKRKNMTKFIRCSLLLLLLNEANLLGGTLFAILTGYTTHTATYT